MHSLEEGIEQEGRGGEGRRQEEGKEKGRMEDRGEGRKGGFNERRNME